MIRWLVLMVLLMPACAIAHPARMMSANLSIASDGRFVVRVHFDLLAYLLNDTPARVDDAAMNVLLEGPADVMRKSLEQAQSRMLRGISVICDGKVIRAERIEFPTVRDIEKWKSAAMSQRLPVMQDATLYGQIPLDAKAVAIKLPEVLGQAIITIERPGEEMYSEPVDAGNVSSALLLHLKLPSPARTWERAQDPSTITVLFKYVLSGFAHIIPQGLDHILFVVGLFLLSTNWRDLLWQITAFTVAHSITLALAMFGVLSLRASIVEPIIAMSIAFVAIENLCTRNLRPWRVLIVFAFGLIHGLGFASVLQETGLPQRQFVPAIISFNLGVELGQLAVIAMAFLMVGWFRKNNWYRNRIVIPASIVIALTALVWTVQRIII